MNEGAGLACTSSCSYEERSLDMSHGGALLRIKVVGQLDRGRSWCGARASGIDSWFVGHGGSSIGRGTNLPSEAVISLLPRGPGEVKSSRLSASGAHLSWSSGRDCRGMWLIGDESYSVWSASDVTSGAATRLDGRPVTSLSLSVDVTGGCAVDGIYSLFLAMHRKGRPGGSGGRQVIVGGPTERVRDGPFGESGWENRDRGPKLSPTAETISS